MWDLIVSVPDHCLSFNFSDKSHHSDQFDFVSSLWCIDCVREPLCEPDFLCIFVLRNTSGSSVKFVDSKTYFALPPPSPTR